jgi:RNA polymerase sigma-70 factor (sigma-E family)
MEISPAAEQPGSASEHTYVGEGSGMDDERRQFTEYFAARRDAVRRTAYLICGDWHWADDLTQAAFIRLAAGWHRIRDRQAVDAFVRTCLVRAYLAETRRMWRRRERTVAEPPEVAGGEDDADAVARRLLFARALREVPPRQRVTLVCRFYQGLDVAETAVALGCSEGTVKSQTARGLAALRRVLGDAIEPSAALVGTKEAS